MQEDKTIRERLNGMFSRYSFVGIRNITKQPFSWTVALEQYEIVKMSPGDDMDEAMMARRKSGSFLPGESTPTREGTKVVRYDLAPGERKLVAGEAAYVLVDKIFTAKILEEFGNGREGYGKLRVPMYIDKYLPLIIPGPIVNNVADALQGVLEKSIDKLNSTDLAQQLNDTGFTDIQAKQSIPQPAVLDNEALMAGANQIGLPPIVTDENGELVNAQPKKPQAGKSAAKKA